tara:strand:- start:3439 stop:3720 length:282 start_codon:yes stop_codon:yes gene_type:complete
VFPETDIWNKPKLNKIYHAQMVLCFYRVYSAYKQYGSIDGAKMIHVNKSSEILDEFTLQMDIDLKIGEKALGIPEPSRYVLLGYRPFCGEKRF